MKAKKKRKLNLHIQRYLALEMNIVVVASFTKTMILRKVNINVMTLYLKVQNQ